MEQEKKLEILMGYIIDSLQVDENQKKAIRAAMQEGLMKIQSIEQAEKAAVERYYDFSVEKVQEGFAFWNRGGFDRRLDRGSAMLAVGLGGEKLRKLRMMREKNGRHSLAVVYPGCYISEAKSVSIVVPMLVVYQIIRFAVSDDGYIARCRLVWQDTSNICKVRKQDISELIEATGNVSLTPELYRLEW